MREANLNKQCKHGRKMNYSPGKEKLGKINLTLQA